MPWEYLIPDLCGDLYPDDIMTILINIGELP